MIAVIDYGMGNLRSVAKALESAGANEVKLSSDAGIIQQADKIVLPGVGAIKEAMRELKRLGLIKVINKNIFKKPFLGICLGLQLLFERSEEGGRVRGLGVFKGTVRRFPDKLKVPHMGWNQINIKYQISPAKAGSRLLLNDEREKTKNTNQKPKISNLFLKNIPDGSYFYFCHSYYAAPQDKNIIAATTDYGLEFASAIRKDNLFACQFHPEKSQSLGLKLLKNFVELK
ncbi:MAG: imidazole glycerol phosphate synthase, glutamine amidotransferase subunit [Omnitrophica WOR_2 bacterium GWB2_45_9]|nr:MAG: imidazole glycerol phosphate synthase, glutamine amidotransferase subunit [Omnitrophica WOR_2 bacterium GWB2_45_9]OGX52500.1 MAG: imidazole glycerol phosphate synthase, glutamine amidotransferase subunit [Omnitrophica WOR_2 bacterium RIFOXYB2_FULL_45_11]